MYCKTIIDQSYQIHGGGDKANALGPLTLGPRFVLN
jgi:hypothetical protein